jgi:hypothetical protein
MMIWRRCAMIWILFTCLASPLEVLGQDEALPVRPMDDPRLPNGQVDYLAKLNSQLKQGITPDNNAVVPLISILGSQVLEGMDQQQALKELGLRELPTETSQLVLQREYTSKRGLVEPSSEYDQWLTMIDTAAVQPWTTDQHPDLAEWVAANSPALEAVERASHLPRFFWPLIPVSKPDDSFSEIRILTASQRMFDQLREIAQLLAIRAMHRLGDRDLESAIRDIQTIRRLASLMTQSPGSVEMLHSRAVEDRAFLTEIALVESGILKSEHCVAYRKYIATPLAPLHVPQRIKTLERFIFLDALQSLQRGESVGMDMKFDLSKLDVEEIEKASVFYDSMADCWQEPKPLNRFWKLAVWQNDLMEVVVGRGEIWKVIDSDASIEDRSRFFGDFLVSLFAANFYRLAEAETRRQTNLDLLNLALALESYRLAHGVFPETLEELQPEHIQSAPLDPYSERAFIYRKKFHGYQLYSIGPNEVDNQGRRSEGSNSWDDYGITIRLPHKE